MEKNRENKFTDRVFVKSFLIACVNLYGAVSVEELYEIGKIYAEKKGMNYPEKSELAKMVKEFRQERDSFLVFDAAELNKQMQNSDFADVVMNPNLISVTGAKFENYHRLKAHMQKCDFYVPENLLSYEDASTLVSDEEKQLLTYINNMVVNMDEYADQVVEKILKCSGHKGECLGDFSWMNPEETYIFQCANGEIQGKEGNPETVRALIKLYDRTEAQKVLDHLKEWNHYGDMPLGHMFQFTMMELDAVGAGLDKMQVKEFVKLICNQHNNQHLWCARGWKPNDLEIKQ